MLNGAIRALGLIPPVLLALSACSDDTSGPPASSGDLAPGITAVQSSDRRGLDAEFANLSREVPAFGGLYFGDGNVVTVSVTDLTKQNVVRPVVDRYLRGGPAGGSSRLVFKQVRYNFTDLLTWKERARTLLSDPGVVFLDADESQNSVTIGVRDAGVGAKVRGALAGLGIPAEAVRLEQSELPVPAATVRQAVRPTVGGTQITNRSTGGICTLGVNVLRNGVRGFITNSHCTRIRGGVESTPFAQASGSTTHATEVLDPTYFTGGVCPVNFRCRYSDAAVANYVSSVTSTSKVAETAPGSLTISAMSSVNKEYAVPGPGIWLQKTGRTTGQTVGRSNRSCVDTGVAGASTIRLLCQGTAYGTNIAGPGDSGAPVWFKIVDGGVTTLYLSGIFWGFTTNEIFFSDIARVHQELGAFQIAF